MRDYLPTHPILVLVVIVVGALFLALLMFLATIAAEYAIWRWKSRAAARYAKHRKVP